MNNRLLVSASALKLSGLAALKTSDEGSPLAFNVDDSGNLGYWANGGADPSTWPGSGAGYRGYHGFAFSDGAGSGYFGWADVGTTAYTDGDPASFAIDIYGYAYEDCTVTGIATGATSGGASCAAVPEPGSLALFALGAAGLMRRRRGLPVAA